MKLNGLWCLFGPNRSEITTVRHFRGHWNSETQSTSSDWTVLYHNNALDQGHRISQLQASYIPLDTSTGGTDEHTKAAITLAPYSEHAFFVSRLNSAGLLCTESSEESIENDAFTLHWGPRFTQLRQNPWIKNDATRGPSYRFFGSVVHSLVTEATSDDVERTQFPAPTCISASFPFAAKGCSNAVSLSAEMKLPPGSFTPSAASYLVSFCCPGSSSVLRLVATSANSVAIVIEESTVSRVVASAAVQFQANFSHVLCSISAGNENDSASLSLYLNGNLVITSEISGPLLAVLSSAVSGRALSVILELAEWRHLGMYRRNVAKNPLELQALVRQPHCNWARLAFVSSLIQTDTAAASLTGELSNHVYSFNTGDCLPPFARIESESLEVEEAAPILSESLVYASRSEAKNDESPATIALSLPHYDLILAPGQSLCLKTFLKPALRAGISVPYISASVRPDLKLSGTITSVYHYLISFCFNNNPFYNIMYCIILRYGAVYYI